MLSRSKHEAGMLQRAGTIEGIFVFESRLAERESCVYEIALIFSVSSFRRVLHTPVLLTL